MSQPVFVSQSLLMVSPDHFEVSYAINPHMLDDDGQLKKVDTSLAIQQWKNLFQLYQELGLQVNVLSGVKGLPDMVFAANQSFPFLDHDGAPAVILSRMNNPQRFPEVRYFREWYKAQGYRIYESETFCFEGTGDALPVYGTSRLLGGWGFRTARPFYSDQLEERFGFETIPLELIDDRFYHLDTCLVVLSEKVAAFVPEAFREEGRQAIQSCFEKVIPIPVEEALEFFAGNAFCPNFKHVLLHPGAQRFKESLLQNGFTPIECDTSEYLKAGGSVFCMKMVLPIEI